MSHYEIEMKVKLKLVYKDTAWVTHALENCIDSEEQVKVETIKEEWINDTDNTKRIHMVHASL